AVGGALRLDLAGHREHDLARVRLERLEPRVRQHRQAPDLVQVDLRAGEVAGLREEPRRAAEEQDRRPEPHPPAPKWPASAGPSFFCVERVNHTTTMMGKSTTKLNPNTKAGQPESGSARPKRCAMNGRIAT